jgi:sulfonate transport system substrate-binding protein
MRETLGNIYRDIGEFRHAALMHETALQLRRKIFGLEHPAVASSLGNLGELRLRQDQLAEAEAMLRQALAMREKLLGPDHPATAASRAALAHGLLRQRQQAAAGLPSADLPAVIRLARTGGRISEPSYDGGNPFLTARARGAFEEEFNRDGIRVQWTHYSNNTMATEAYFGGLVDFAQQGDGTAVVGRGKGVRHRVLLSGPRFGITFYLMVRADSAFQGLADLKGRRLVTVQGTENQRTLYRLFEQHGFTENDFDIVRLDRGSAVRTAIAAGEIDGTVVTNPFDPDVRDALRVIEKIDAPRDTAKVSVLWVTEEFERRYPAIVQRMVTAMVKTTAWICDDRNRAAVFELWAKPDQSTAAVEAKWAGKSLKEQLSPLLDDYFFAALRRSLDEARHSGTLRDEVSLADWVEPKYLNNALKELKLEGFWPELEATGKLKGGR